jgi:hypothetical protein
MSTTTTTTTATKATLNTLNTKSQDIEIPRGPVTSTLIFYAPPPDNSAPWNYVEQPPPGFPQRNYTEYPSTVEISDIRNQESSFSLNTHGFTTASNIPSKCKDFTSEEQIKQIYYPEVEKLILDQFQEPNACSCLIIQSEEQIQTLLVNLFIAPTSIKRKNQQDNAYTIISPLKLPPSSNLASA